ncbi:MAG: phage holin family protein [Oscillospiraceae bacterium]|nr:phage holin family protein [Oscillospiraceae bacterium]
MSISDWGIVSVPVIAVICFLVGEAVKLAPINRDWIPVICGLCGGALGVVAMKFMPEFPAHDILTAIAVGIVSGWASCGVYETIKNVTIKIPQAEKQGTGQKDDVPSVLGEEDEYTGKH